MSFAELKLKLKLFCVNFNQTEDCCGCCFRSNRGCT